MKIFLPFRKYENHPYIEEIRNYSNNDFIFDSIFNFKTKYSIINFHWPEAIFEWKEPTHYELDNLEKIINKIKRSAVIMYTKHDFERTKGTTPNFSRLYKIIEENTDVFIHLGKFSKAFYKTKYPNADHEIIYHPIYEKSFSITPKSDARRMLGIEKDALVVIAPGQIRSHKERNLVIKSFDALNHKEKVLIATNMRDEINFDFPGRIRLKIFFDVRKFLITRFRKKFLPPKYLFSYSPRTSEDLSIQISAADIVLVPRINILNSGLVFLGLTFQKVIVGPAVGNIGEQLEELNFPAFQPDSLQTVTKAIETGIKLNLKGDYIKNPLTKYLPVNVANEYDRIFQKYQR